jgi:hypothetical protein
VKKQKFVVPFLLIISIVSVALVSLDANASRYKRSDIADSRFGVGERERLLKLAYTFSETVSSKIKGQEAAADAMQARLIQYFESFPNRSGEPVSLNLVGLSGVGKSAMIATLAKMGFNVVHFEAQRYSSIYADFGQDVVRSLYEPVTEKKPVILVVEEIDKVPEILSNGEVETSRVIGALNQILSDGMISQSHGKPIDVSNIMVLTTMNFPQNEFSAFTKEVLKQEKSVFDFSIDDFKTFDTWIKSSPGARYKILSKLFRPNTVGRLAPNTVVMEPLSSKAYREIIRQTVSETVSRVSQGLNQAKRIQIEVDESYFEFLEREAIYAPSGARETVLRSNVMTEQVINFGIKIEDPFEPSTDRPRKLSIAFNSDSQSAIISVTPQVLRGKELFDTETFSGKLGYNSLTREFERVPSDLAAKPRYDIKGTTVKPFSPTKKLIRETRFPKIANLSAGLVEAIGESLLGQTETAKTVQDDLNRYLSRQGSARKEPAFRVLSGFPGIGKSEMVKITARHLGLPIVKVNMQQLSSDDPKAVQTFFDIMTKAIEKATAASKDGKYILLIEELDKLYEIDPQGLVKNRPLMGVIKDLLNDGLSTTTTSSGSYEVEKNIDIRDAFTFVTMNFSVDRFDFKADPRITTIEDVLEAWKTLKSTPMAVKSLLGRIFLPETVSRLFSRFTIVKPPNRREYRELVRRQVENVVKQRILDENGNNRAQIDIKMSKRYEDYLFGETVIASEGARNTVVSGSSLIASDIEDALRALPKGSKLSATPIVLTLDYLPGKTEVLIKVASQSEPDLKPEEILRKPVQLKFPGLSQKGRLSAERILVAAHEFGHAFGFARFGIPFEFVVTASPTPGTGGYVKTKSSPFSAIDYMGTVYSLLASRAMERIILSENARAPESLMRITSGSSTDIKMATASLYNMMYELGFDSQGGTVDRNFVMGISKYADFASIPPEEAEKLGRVLRELENQIVDDFLTTESVDWYVEKISKLARVGVMSESVFFELIGYQPITGDQDALQNNLRMQKLFEKVLVRKPKAATKAREIARGIEGLSVDQHVEKFLGMFSNSFQKTMYGDIPNSKKSYQCKDLFKTAN